MKCTLFHKNKPSYTSIFNHQLWTQCMHLHWECCMHSKWEISSTNSLVASEYFRKWSNQEPTFAATSRKHEFDKRLQSYMWHTCEIELYIFTPVVHFAACGIYGEGSYIIIQTSGNYNSWKNKSPSCVYNNRNMMWSWFWTFKNSHRIYAVDQGHMSSPTSRPLYTEKGLHIL